MGTHLHRLAGAPHLLRPIPDRGTQALDYVARRHAELVVPGVDGVDVGVAEFGGRICSELVDPAPRHEEELPVGDVGVVEGAAGVGRHLGWALGGLAALAPALALAQLAGLAPARALAQDLPAPDYKVWGSMTISRRLDVACSGTPMLTDRGLCRRR
jgi:hypothetical protein